MKKFLFFLIISLPAAVASAQSEGFHSVEVPSEAVSGESSSDSSSFVAAALGGSSSGSSSSVAASDDIVADRFPNGEEIPEWFGDTSRIDVNSLGNKYVITDYGVVRDSTILQTEAIQRVIDLAAENGGGVIVIPEGTFLSGSLFFRQGTHLKLEEGGVLKGIDDIRRYPVVTTRIEGQTRKYFAALVNADGIDGFTITGPGTVNGNGLRFWEEFWVRKQYNPDCTNLEAMRPRLVFISNCSNVQVQDVRLINSAFWTNHIYRCDHVKYLGCYIYAPTSGVKAPSSDALDIDACHDVLVDGCYMNVNDDAVVLKGGKGTFADLDPDNGPNYNIIVQNCTYGKVMGCLTLGSESLHDWNVIVRNIEFSDADRVLWLKMRPDTPQHYELVTIENVRGNCRSFLVVRPWMQFYNLEPREDMPLSRCNDIVFRGAQVSCRTFFDVGASDKYELRDFSFIDCDITEDAPEGSAPMSSLGVSAATAAALSASGSGVEVGVSGSVSETGVPASGSGSASLAGVSASGSGSASLAGVSASGAEVGIFGGIIQGLTVSNLVINGVEVR